MNTPINELLSLSLVEKIGAIVEYMDDLRLGKRTKDTKALNNLLDDPEVASWLTMMKRQNRIPRRFVGRDNGGW